MVNQRQRGREEGEATLHKSTRTCLVPVVGEGDEGAGAIDGVQPRLRTAHSHNTTARNPQPQMRLQQQRAATYITLVALPHEATKDEAGGRVCKLRRSRSGSKEWCQRYTAAVLVARGGGGKDDDEERQSPPRDKSGARTMKRKGLSGELRISISSMPPPAAAGLYTTCPPPNA
jgi:hypothetical protein